MSPDAGLHVAEPHSQHRKARLVRRVSASQWNSRRSFPAAPRLSPHHRFDARNRLSPDCTLDRERVNRRPSFQTERSSMDDRVARETGQQVLRLPHQAPATGGAPMRLCVGIGIVATNVVFLRSAKRLLRRTPSQGGGPRLPGTEPVTPQMLASPNPR